MNELSWLVPSVVGLFGLAIAWYQLRAGRLESFADRRPYVVCEYVREKGAKGADAVFLQISNVGETPAFDVRLDFGDRDDWHWVRPANFPFLNSEGGLSVLVNGHPVRYFVGTLSQNSVLKNLEMSHLNVSVTYNALQGSGKKIPIKEEARLTLQSYRYRSKA